ncbi:MAG: nucleotide-binding protein [Chitinophagaceae bacterium]
MVRVLPKYEILFSDLRNHFIGSFLISREFKLFMSENGYYEQWKHQYEEVRLKRGYFALGTDHEFIDATNTLALYINAIPQNKEVEAFISEVIAQFIDCKKEKDDFTDIVQSMKLSKFSDENIQLVLTSIEKYNKKKFPKIRKAITQKNIVNTNKVNNRDIFIVHGHNEEIKHNVARLLQKINLNPIILNEQSNEGLTIIEKFEKYSNVSFAIILLTYDDYGNSKTVEKKNKRARQNVILELGYFTAKLGRKNVLPLYEDDVELPSDISGVLYTRIDESENWKFRVVKELKTAGFNVDANDIL